MLQANLMMNIEKKFSDVFQLMMEQLRFQNQHLITLYQNNEKVNENLQRKLEKLKRAIYQLSYQEQITNVNQIEIIKNQQYQYELKMDQNLELPCYRCRIFSIKLRLMENDILIQNINNILVELQTWTYDKVPKKLIRNNQNQSIYKGCQQATIRKGCGCLNQVQIKEVSSHFPKGMFMLVIVPVEDGGVIGNQEKLEIKKEWIKPLMINGVQIKAKKFTDRHKPYYAKSDGTIYIGNT